MTTLITVLILVGVGFTVTLAMRIHQQAQVMRMIQATVHKECQRMSEVEQ